MQQGRNVPCHEEQAPWTNDLSTCNQIKTFKAKLNKAAYKISKKTYRKEISALVERTERMNNAFVCQTYNLYHSKEERLCWQVKALHIIRKLIKVLKIVERRLHVNSTEALFSWFSSILQKGSVQNKHLRPGMISKAVWSSALFQDHSYCSHSVSIVIDHFSSLSRFIFIPGTLGTVSTSIWIAV